MILALAVLLGIIFMAVIAASVLIGLFFLPSSGDGTQDNDILADDFEDEEDW